MTPFDATNRVTSPYGWRTYTTNAGATIREFHYGIDVVPTRYAGESVADDAWDFREVTGGRVIEVSTGWNAGRGTLIKVQTAPGVIEFYQHCAAVYVKAGQQVPQGTVLGRAGATGNVTGAHLHFEVQVNGTPVEPSAWLGLPNAAGTYGSAEEEQPGLQLLTVGPVYNAGAMILWGIANKLGLGYDAQYTDDTKTAQVLTIGPASAGDAMTVWAKAQELGAPYKSEYVG